MKTLADAWKWYQATKKNLSRMQRLALKHWDDLSSKDTSLWRDDDFRMLEASDIVSETSFSLKPIDDLAVVVMFSVFEASVRDYLIAMIEPQAKRITDPILKQSADDALQGVKEGSFYLRVLEPLKNQDRVSVALITQINQIRDYRNWVAHGRRDAPTNNVTPEEARNRLAEFLAALGIATTSEEPQPDRPDDEYE